MKDSLRIGILGPAERGAVWEERLRPHASVREVVLSDSLEAIGPVDAIVLLEENRSRMDLAQQIILRGMHAFVVGRMPVERHLAERLSRLSEESGTVVQFANWSLHNPTTQFMMANIRRPDLMVFQREFTFAHYRDVRASFDSNWHEDLALILKWMDSSVHRVDVSRIPFADGETLAVHLNLRFDNGSTASLYCGIAHEANRHVRFATDSQLAAECDVTRKRVRLIQHGGQSSLFADVRSFDKEEPAKMAVAMFLKSVQMRGPASYSAHDLLRFTRVLESVERGTFRS
jgi:hypothetical protein